MDEYEVGCCCCCHYQDSLSMAQRVMDMFKIPQYARVKNGDGYDEYWMLQENVIRDMRGIDIRKLGDYYGKFLSLIGRFVDGKLDLPDMHRDFLTDKRFIEIEPEHVEHWIKVRDEFNINKEE